MKKVLLGLLILLVGFGGYILYDTKFKKEIAFLDIEEDLIDIDKLFIYGTHLNMEGNIQDTDDVDLVFYNGDFISYDINILDSTFNLSSDVNNGIELDNIPIGNYYLFIRSKIVSDDAVSYKYYALKNETEYQEMIYYTLSNVNQKITIKNEDSYPTMMINVTKNTDDDIYDVVIDAGHGGIDSGAIKNGYKEADLTLKLAVLLAERLENDGLKVKLTHDEGELASDEKLEEYGVHGRAVIPHEVNAKYLISLHMNSNSSESVNGLEVYTADNINYDLAKLFVNNIISITGLSYSNNKINKVTDGIYTRNFTEEEIKNSTNEKEEENLIPYDITTNSNYYYIIRETGGIVTGAYVDNRNEEILENSYVNSNIGVETYLLELGYISNKSDLNNMVNNMDKYVDAIARSLESVYIVEE